MAAEYGQVIGSTKSTIGDWWLGDRRFGAAIHDKQKTPLLIIF